jgi:hypothetical protein
LALIFNSGGPRGARMPAAELALLAD